VPGYIGNYYIKLSGLRTNLEEERGDRGK
jgi:hypothetical protein